MNKNKNFDIAVIGGGPAGMFSAGIAGQDGAKVILLEKNAKLGQKLLITGKGRCNITNSSLTSKDLVNIFGKNGKFLYSSFNAFNVTSVLDFFDSMELKTKVERGNRVFPVSDKASDVLKVLENFTKENHVTVKTSSLVKKIQISNHKITKIILSNNDEICANKYIICTGGLSYPSTGSTGDGFTWAKQLGHTVVPTKPALTPLLLKETFIKKLQGLSLKNVNIKAMKNDITLDERFGEALFTHEGISGPIILDMSKVIEDSLSKGNVTLSIDFKPALNKDKLDKRIQRDFKEILNKSFKNSLDDLLPKKLIPIIINISNIDPEKKIHSITKEERHKLVALLKDLRVTVTGVTGFEKAVITSGGISLKEIDPKTMKSKIIDNLYFSGEILDIDGPTGGYNLQVCWSTGYVAGKSVSIK